MKNRRTWKLHVCCEKRWNEPPRGLEQRHLIQADYSTMPGQ